MIDTAQRDLERLGDAGELAEGEIGVVELALGEAFVDHAVDQLLDRLDVALAAGSNHRLAGVGHHHDRGLAGLGPGAGVGEQRGVHAGVGACGLAVEIGHHAGAVVLRDERLDLLGQAVTAGQLRAPAHVVLDHVGALQGVERVMRVAAIGLVLDVHVRFRQLADVVVVGANSDEEGVGFDLAGGALGHRGHELRVMESAGRLFLETA